MPAGSAGRPGAPPPKAPATAVATAGDLWAGVIKKGVAAILIAFAAYSVVATPDAAADAVRSAGNGGQHVIKAVIEFFNALTPAKSA